MGINRRPHRNPKASCFSCHAEHAARDNVFVQFYGLLNDAAPNKKWPRIAGPTELCRGQATRRSAAESLPARGISFPAKEAVSLQRQLRAPFQTTFVLTGILAVPNALPQTPEPNISVLLARVATYERQFEREFSTMVGQEHYAQRWGGFSLERDASSDKQRVIESEVLFVWVPAVRSMAWSRYRQLARAAVHRNI